ncbi:histone deacetylase family protein [Crocosphaera sp.]|uniref:histone deacetylase family protein n=1 Tax=Crocosphaera sp. TaxID=2729996 RepID=UPI003F266997|nr:histone deacetylase [Crocosphaera sp.]
MFPIIYSDTFLNHETGSFHPESPQRLEAIVEALKTVAWSDRLQWQQPTSLKERDPLTQIRNNHTNEYIERVAAIAGNGGGFIDGDTVVSPRSYEVALLAVNAWLDGVDTVLKTQNPAFVLSRPPGHHAVATTGMGFCLFSNAAIAADYALQCTGVQRVAILDWDVHHGNGTQAIVENNPHIAYCSLHQFPAYPGTGRANETGKYNNILNIPMSPGSDLQNYQLAFSEQVVPFLEGFQGDLLIVSAGYDANQADPLASINLQPDDYSLFTQQLLTITSSVLFGLEGGYDLPTLSQSVVKTIQGCFSALSR